MAEGSELLLLCILLLQPRALVAVHVWTGGHLFAGILLLAGLNPFICKECFTQTSRKVQAEQPQVKSNADLVLAGPASVIFCSFDGNGASHLSLH